MTPQQAAALTDEEINITIATLTGWTKSAKGWWSHPTLPDRGGAMFSPPDFCNDLNAVHEVINSLIDYDKEAQYIKDLKSILMSDSGVSEFDVCNATARQRCEALLVTMGGKE